MRWLILGWLLPIGIIVPASLKAQMVKAAIDKPGEPFSYPACPTDEIAVQNAPMGTEITPAGYLYTGFGELMFSLGFPARPAWQRVRTLGKGYLPIFHYTYRDGTVRYDLTTFAAPLSSQNGESRPVNFIRVIARDVGSENRTSYFSVAFRYTGAGSEPSPCNLASHRFARPVIPAGPGNYSQPGVAFDPHWVYGFKKNLATRSGKAVYEFSTAPRPALRLTETSRYSKPEQPRVSPGTPILVTQYELHLQPGSSETLIFKMPVRPIPVDDADAIQELESSGFDAVLGQTESLWEKRLRRGIQISLPEKEATNTFKAGLIYDMMARERVGKDYIQTVNDLQYHAFWLRDGSHIMNAYDETGYLNLVRQSLPFFLKCQKPDGLFLSQSGQYDGWGQALWTLGRYYQFSSDRAFARSVFPAVVRAVHWLEQARRKDPLEIMPAANPHDDEFDVTAHVTGHNFWALAGLKEAIVLAKAVGAPAQVREFQQDYQDYHQVLFGLLDAVATKDGGAIPPGLDVPGGQDWGNMNVLYPEMLVPAGNPLVASTLRRVRKEYGEGLMTYAGRLHDYTGFRNAETELIVGEPKRVVRGLYAELVHTESTHAGWEVGPIPWTTRDFGNDLAPHGWFAAEYVTLLRNMLVREQGDDLHLLSALSPDWTKPGDTIQVSNAPTLFGRMKMECKFSRSGMRMSLEPDFRQKPAHIVVHLPWFVTVRSATVDGSSVEAHQHWLSLPPSSKEVEVLWTLPAPAPPMSYRSAVKALEREYRAQEQRRRATRR